MESLYRAYRDRLERLHAQLVSRVAREAPDLIGTLSAAAPAPLRVGYQLLPKLVDDPAPTTSAARASTVSYSWPRTESFILRDLATIDRLETSKASGEVAASSAFREQVDSYLQLVESADLIGSHIQHNLFWQKEIHRNREGYEAATLLHDAVLERQRIIDERVALEASNALDLAGLHDRAQTLLATIRRETSRVVAKPFVRIERRAPTGWVFIVPVVTDIEDDRLVERVRDALEESWRLDDGTEQFRLEIVIRRMSASELYACTEGDAAGQRPCGAPAPGAPVDLADHANRFPADAAVLTSGATITHVNGRTMFLGPQDVAPNVLAHEFGHLLGFVDGYFRGYRDLGDAGYEILEVVADPADIMSSAGTGRVGRHHFDRLLGR